MSLTSSFFGFYITELAGREHLLVVISEASLCAFEHTMGVNVFNAKATILLFFFPLFCTTAVMMRALL